MANIRILSQYTRYPKMLYPRKVAPVKPFVSIENMSLFSHLRIFQFFGEIPIQISSTNPSKISVPFLIVSVVYSILNCTHYILYRPASSRWGNTGKFTSALVIAEKVVYSVTPPLITILSLRNRFKYEATMKKFIPLQVMLGIIHFKMFRSIIFLALACGIVICSNLAHTIAICTSWYASDFCWYDLLDQIFFFVLEIITIAYIGLFSYYAQIISSCLNKMSQTLNTGESNPKMHIRTYNDLVEIAADINEFFDPILSIALIAGVMVIIVSSTSVMFSQDNKDTLEKLMNFLWILAIVIALLHILYICHHAKDQVNNIECLFEFFLLCYSSIYRKKFMIE